MVKQLFNSIFAKKNEAQKPSVPAFTITENGPLKADFEVSELSYEEYVKFVNEERRKLTRYVNQERRNSAGACAA
ncbi:MAG: hypothetical protein A3I83_00310 [Methylotenera sp. RIFCSPLOWO2_02_FULL_45_14]|nr:MAG: hypothetical protein A3I83_00310 [Methylotenera sp. RIFCSPLOWO2_02_FULL_45_14]